VLASEPRTCNDQWRRELSVPSDQTLMALVLSQNRTNTACMMSPLRREGNLEQELRDVTEKYKPGNSTRSECKTNTCFAFAPWTPGPAIRNDRNSITRASFAQWSPGPAIVIWMMLPKTVETPVSLDWSWKWHAHSCIVMGTLFRTC